MGQTPHALRCPLCKELVATRDGKHYGNHYPTVTAMKPCEMSCKPIQEETLMGEITIVEHGDKTPVHALKVENIFSKLQPYLIDRAIATFSGRPQRTMATPEVYHFGRIINGELSDDVYQDFALRVNHVFSVFNGQPRRMKDVHTNEEIEVCPRVDSALAVPMMIPLYTTTPTMKRSMLLAYLFIVDLPVWRYEERRYYDVDAGIVMVNQLVGEQGLIAVHEGCLPCEHKSVKECGACKRQFCLHCEHALEPNTREEVKTVGHCCVDCTKGGKGLFGVGQ
jgi:hypothetical protein